MSRSPTALVEGVLAGNRRAIGRAITLLESRGEGGREVLAALYPHTGGAVRVGLTGPPGVGKSTLTGALVAERRRADQTVGIISVDPTSPFTGGAVLGDRIRLTDHFTDPGVFIRSMASRGHLGGVSEGTLGAMEVLEAAGYDVVIIETVGSGQNEVEVREIADTVVLVLMPGSGDAIQALKAGVMEIPDVIAINKADHPDVDRLRAELAATLSMAPAADWEIPVVETVANTGRGVDELWAAVERHRAFLDEDGRLRARRRDGMRSTLRALALGRLGRRIDGVWDREAMTELAARVEGREVDPDGAVDEILSRLASPGSDRTRTF